MGLTSVGVKAVTELGGDAAKGLEKKAPELSKKFASEDMSTEQKSGMRNQGNFALQSRLLSALDLAPSSTGKTGSVSETQSDSLSEALDLTPPKMAFSKKPISGNSLRNFQKQHQSSDSLSGDDKSALSAKKTEKDVSPATIGDEHTRPITLSSEDGEEDAGKKSTIGDTHTPPVTPPPEYDEDEESKSETIGGAHTRPATPPPEDEIEEGLTPHPGGDDLHAQPPTLTSNEETGEGKPSEGVGGAQTPPLSAQEMKERMDQMQADLDDKNQKLDQMQQNPQASHMEKMQQMQQDNMQQQMELQQMQAQQTIDQQRNAMQNAELGAQMNNFNTRIQMMMQEMTKLNEVAASAVK